MGLSSVGIGSNLNVTEMVAGLVALEKKPIAALQVKATAINSQMSAYSQLKSQISNLQTQVNKLTSAATWQGRILSSSNTAVVSGTATTKAAYGTFDVLVQKMASAQSVGSSLVPSGTALGQGKMTINLGEWGTDGKLVTNEVDGKPQSVTIDIGPEDDTLAKIAAKINAANGGVTATVLRDHTGERLALQSTETGSNAAFSVEVQEDAANPGLGRFAYSGVDSADMKLSQKALNTEATINGIAMSSRNNVFDEVADGVSLTVSQKSADGDPPVRIAIKGDTEAAKTALKNFVESYNALSSAMTTMMAYDKDTKTAGTLQGDSTAMNLQSALRRLLTSGSGAGGAFTALSQTGLEFQANGSLKIDDEKLTKALEDPDSMAKFFAADLEGSDNDGLGVRLKEFTTGLLSSDGVFATRDESMKGQLKRNTQDQERMMTRVNAYEKRLLAQYTALDVKMASLTALDSYISQQVSQWNKPNR